MRECIANRNALQEVQERVVFETKKMIPGGSMISWKRMEGNEKGKYSVKIK